LIIHQSNRPTNLELSSNESAHGIEKNKHPGIEMITAYKD